MYTISSYFPKVSSKRRRQQDDFKAEFTIKLRIISSNLRIKHLSNRWEIAEIFIQIIKLEQRYDINSARFMQSAQDPL